MAGLSISGLDKLRDTLREVQEALEGINGQIATLYIDPNDPDAETKAISEMEEAVDAKVAAFRDNDVVAKLAEKSKEVYANEIRQRVRQARNSAG